MSEPDWDAATENRYEQHRGGYICGTHDLHPFECGAGCPHCARAHTDGHDPGTCELCDPEYDQQPNSDWEARLERGRR